MLDYMVHLSNKEGRWKTATDEKTRREFTVKRLLVSRLQGKFERLVKRYMNEMGYNQEQLADLVGMQRSHLNALLNSNRPLSAYYLTLFIFKGVIKVSEICDEQPTNTKEKEFWDSVKVLEKMGLMHKIAVLEKAGVDIEGILDSILKTLPPRK